MMESSYSDGVAWQDEVLRKLQLWHGKFVSSADLWLDHAAAIDLTNKSPDSKHVSWNEEWNQFTTFASWPDLKIYQQSMMNAFHDGIKAAESVGTFVWLSVRPIIYSLCYILWKLLQHILGTLLPTFQYAFVKLCRFQLHLTWRQAVGELACFFVIFAAWKLVKFLKKQKYVQRCRKYCRQKAQQFKKKVQAFYKFVADTSLLLAMALPHSTYLLLAIAVKWCFPDWVARIATDSPTTSLLKWCYPFVATVSVLHHARAFNATKAADDGKDKGKASNKGKSGKNKSALSTAKKGKDGKDKKKSRRRRSSLGALLHRSGKEGDITGGNDEYTEEEMREDVNYWLRFWTIYGFLKATYFLVSNMLFVGSIVTSPKTHSAICQFELLFYIWIFLLPECLVALYPSSVDEERRDWSDSKQLLYECALKPVEAMPKLFSPIVVPVFEKVSQAIPPSFWKLQVVDKIQLPLNALVFIKILSEPKKDALVDIITNFHSMVIPALLLFSPSFITIYGVWYVQFIVPLAYSFKALHREYRFDQRVLYLKFWTLYGVIAFIIANLVSFFWWMPFCTHLTFLAWCVLVTPRPINTIYKEFDRDLQAFGLLPKVDEDVAVQDTHTVRVLSFLARNLPSASDADRKEEEGDTKEGNASQQEGKETKENAADKSTSKREMDKGDAHNERKEKSSTKNVTLTDNRNKSGKETRESKKDEVVELKSPENKDISEESDVQPRRSSRARQKAT